MLIRFEKSEIFGSDPGHTFTDSKFSDRIHSVIISNPHHYQYAQMDPSGPIVTSKLNYLMIHAEVVMSGKLRYIRAFLGTNSS